MKPSIWLALVLFFVIPGCSGCAKKEIDPTTVESEPSPERPETDSPTEKPRKVAPISTVDTPAQSPPEDAAESDGETSPAGRGDSNSTPAKDRSKRSVGPNTPADAVVLANGFKGQSDSAADGDEFGRAFELAVQAWEATQNFPDDAECQKLGDELLVVIDRLGDKANSQNRATLRTSKPLMVK